MTFLEYVCERLLGQPARPGGADGESYWVCPFHDDTNPSFHTLPRKPGMKDRFRCFACGMRGDEFDLLRELHPGEDYSRRRVRLEQWHRDYEAEVPAAAPVTVR
jgi:DNA primase